MLLARVSRTRKTITVTPNLNICLIFGLMVNNAITFWAKFECVSPMVTKLAETRAGRGLSFRSSIKNSSKLAARKMYDSSNEPKIRCEALNPNNAEMSEA